MLVSAVIHRLKPSDGPALDVICSSLSRVGTHDKACEDASEFLLNTGFGNRGRLHLQLSLSEIVLVMQSGKKISLLQPSERTSWVSERSIEDSQLLVPLVGGA